MKKKYVTPDGEYLDFAIEENISNDANADLLADVDVSTSVEGDIEIEEW